MKIKLVFIEDLTTARAAYSSNTRPAPFKTAGGAMVARLELSLVQEVPAFVVLMIDVSVPEYACVFEMAKLGMGFHETLLRNRSSSVPIYL